MKKLIKFSVPLHISQSIKTDGKMKWQIKTDCLERLMRWIIDLFLKKVEVGAIYTTIREGYYWIGENGQIERREKPVIDEDEEELSPCIGLSINVSESDTDDVVYSNEGVLKITS